MIDVLVTSLASLLIGLCVIQLLLQIGELVLATHALWVAPGERDPNLVWRRNISDAPPVTVIAPAFNEEATIVESVRSLLALRYPEFEIVIVNDGSDDRTMEMMRRAFELRPVTRSLDQALHHKPITGAYQSALHPNLLVLDKLNGGKADALNAGLNAARHPLFCCIDADLILDTDALLRAVGPFIEDPQHVIATGGTVSVANGCVVKGGQVAQVGLSRNLWALFQTVEYIRAFQLARLAWSQLNALAIISGAFGVFRRSVVVDAGGYRPNIVGEDIELVVRLHRRSLERRDGSRIVFVPEPVCWTEAPETLAALGRQRRRWQRGALETLAIHRSMLANPTYGVTGALALGRIVVVDLIGPIAELLGWCLLPALWALGLLSGDYVAAFFAVSVGFGTALSIAAIALQEGARSRAPRIRHLFALSLAAVLENVGYRQLNALWRIQGVVEWRRGVSDWGKMQRRGFTTYAEAV